MRKKQKGETALIIDPDSITGLLDFASLFGRAGSVQIEIGSGKGTFLVSQAAAFPQVNFLGIEWANKYCWHAADRLARHGLDNVRMIRTDAAAFLARHVPDESVEMFHIYFPDPWPKKRHHKRRLFSDGNLPGLLRCLSAGGILNMATDHEGYHIQMRQVAERAIAGGLVEEIAFIRPAGAGLREMVGTNYERKYMKEGRRTYTLALRKT